MSDLNNISKLISSKTKMLWTETQLITLNIVDISALSKVAKKHNLIFVVDNTFATIFTKTY